MSARYVFSSVTRIAAFHRGVFEVELLLRQDWNSGDYVVGQVLGVSGPLRHIELASGRMAEIDAGDLVVGALGQRAATLEACGDWKAIGADLLMHALTSAGLFGKATSKSPYVPEMISLVYRGHVVLDGRRQRMCDHAVRPLGRAFDLPVVLVIGTSMSAGKTESAKVVVSQLRDLGHVVVGAKLTGAARYRDPLAMWDAGATAVFDFVDAGLPSSAVPTPQYLTAITDVLGRMATCGADVAVVEAGASPLEEYNGAALASLIGDRVCFTLLCASDPYAVAGLVSAFGARPDLVAGGAANTTTGVALVEKVSGLRAVNLQDPANHILLKRMLEHHLAQ
jgi:hypothetical protein